MYILISNQYWLMKTFDICCNSKFYECMKENIQFLNSVLSKLSRDGTLNVKLDVFHFP